MEINVLLLGHNGGLGRAFKYLLKIKKIKFFVVKKEMVNFNNLKKIITQKKISHIVNCIAKTNLSYCEKNKIKAYNANTKIPKIICSIIKKTKIKFIHFSTEAVFSGEKNTTYSEKDLPCPKTTYGITKFLAEKKVLNQSNTLVVRLPYLFGQTHDKQIFSKFFKNLLKKKNIYVANDVFSTPIYSPDLCRFIYQNCLKKNKYFDKKLIHFTSGKNMSLYNFVKKITKLKFKKINLKLIHPAKDSEFKNSIKNKPKYLGLTSIYPELISSTSYKRFKL